MTLSIMHLFVTLSINYIKYNDTWHKHWISLCSVSHVHTVIQSVVMLSVILLSVIMMSVIMLSYTECPGTGQMDA
jgi:hypothetical protein